ncbi:MAG: endonuclease NucS [Halobacteriaceae archaeon]
MTAIVDPDLGTARAAVRGGLAAGAFVTVAGVCTATYEGRAASHLGAGDRLLLCKPDGTGLVHGPEGRTPVNWLPGDSDWSVDIDEEVLTVAGERDRPAETLAVRFEQVRQVTTVEAPVRGDREVSGTESDLRERLLADPSLVEPGFRPLATERETPAGPVDVYGEDADGTAVVVEVKRRRAGPDAVGQLARYVDALATDLHAGAAVRGILVAPAVTDRARELLADRGLEFVPLAFDGDPPGTDGDATGS